MTDSDIKRADLVRSLLAEHLVRDYAANPTKISYWVGLEIYELTDPQGFLPYVEEDRITAYVSGGPFNTPTQALIDMTRKIARVL